MTQPVMCTSYVSGSKSLPSNRKKTKTKTHMTLPSLPSDVQDMIHFAEICPNREARDRCSRARRAGKWHRSPDSLARLHLNISGDAATWHNPFIDGLFLL